MLRTDKILKKQPVSPGIPLFLEEWDLASPEIHSELRGVNFNDYPESRSLANQLSQTGQINITEQLDGLWIRTNSFVGSIRIGPIHLVIQPKLTGAPLLNLLRYAYGLRKLRLFPLVNFGTQLFSFQDLLIYQLILEVEELLARGLLRRYIREDKYLSNPSGRIDFQQIIKQGGITNAALPCITHQRLEDCIHNRILLAGLNFATWLTDDLQLRSRARQLASIFDLNVTSIRLDWIMLENVNRESNRLTASYQPAITIIELLMGQQGIEQKLTSPKLRLNGFLFDMNRFFQALISRFLREFLEGFIIEDEHRLLGMMAYLPGFRLNNHTNPMPRPDFALLKEGKLVALMDAKYRDLWDKGLPREMLYQLSIYAMSRGLGGKATIIYPVLGTIPRIARLGIYDPIYENAQSEVIMKPIDLLELDKLIRDGTWNQCNKKALELVLDQE